MVVDFDDVFASDFAGVLDGDGDFAFTLLLIDLMSGDPLLEGSVGFAFAEGEHDFVVVVVVAVGHSAGDVVPVTDIDAFGIFNEFLVAVLVLEGAVVAHRLEGWRTLGIFGPSVAKFARWDIGAIDDLGNGSVAGDAWGADKHD